jgi:hypothetical protein
MDYRFMVSVNSKGAQDIEIHVYTGSSMLFICVVLHEHNYGEDLRMCRYIEYTIVLLYAS